MTDSTPAPDLELLERGWMMKQEEPEPGYQGSVPIYTYWKAGLSIWLGQYLARKREGLEPNVAVNSGGGA